MKYLIINSVCGMRSTGKIVAQEADSLIRKGHTVKILYGRGKVPEHYQDISFRVGNDLDVIWHVIESRLFDNSGFASRHVTKNVVRMIKEYDPDVIHLHNVHGYYINISILFSYLKNCKKKIIWTMHDYWAITGHCSNSSYIGCDKWKTGCFSCPQKNVYPKSIIVDASKINYKKKKDLFCNIPNLIIQVPSEWLKKRITQSFLREYKVDVIPNKVNEEVFRYVKGFFKEKIGVTNKKIILGVSTSWQERKGLYDFYRLQKIIDDNHVIVLVGLTSRQIKELPEGIIGCQVTYDMNELAEIYSAADVLVSMSTEETFGLTVLEAAKCGTPVVVYKDTASEEIVKDYVGRVVEWNVEMVWQAILQVEKKDNIGSVK